MKSVMCVLSILFLCILVMSAGCTGIPGIPGTTSPGQAASTTIADPMGEAGTSWTGTYMTTWQGGGHDIRMVLVQSGSIVSGTYDYNDGIITGTVQDGRLVGTWAEDNGASKGPVEFDMTPDGKNFAGWWGYEGEDLSTIKKNDPSWTGIRVS
jgi:hypothetical protein